MKVLQGRVELPDTKGIELEEKEHYRFRELMIRNKDKRLYRSMMDNRKKREREAKKLEMKRKSHDQQVKSAKKGSKASVKDSAVKSSPAGKPPVKKAKMDA